MMNKRLPYGISNYQDIVAGDYCYVDKTKYIIDLEREPNPYQFFIRPRKFGKSLFITTLDAYYNLNYVDQFDTLFKDTYIGQHPTSGKNKYAVFQFDFSGMDTSSSEEFIKSFEGNIRDESLSFLDKYNGTLLDVKELSAELKVSDRPIGVLRRIFRLLESNGIPLYVIIDEYDHFANDLIALGADEVYKKMVRANGLVRDFYETIKIGTKSALKRIFITGISPVMLDDLTSGFNIAANLTIKDAYNDMLGFTQSEVEQLIVDCKIKTELVNMDQLKTYYDGYLFSAGGTQRIYNPTMLFHYLNNIVQESKPPRNMYDLNLKVDYNRLKQLVSKPVNAAHLQEIIVNEAIEAELIEKFSIDNLGNTQYFVSLLFYMGLLTIDSYQQELFRFRIPNYTIKTLYWEYFREIISDNNQVEIDTTALKTSVWTLANSGDPAPFVTYVHKQVISKLSNRDLQHFDEKYLKVILLSYLLISSIYTSISEKENPDGYADIVLQRSPQFPTVKYEWIFELKYIKTKDKDRLPQVRAEAQQQIARYWVAEKGEQRADLKTAILIFVGKNVVEVINQQ